MSTEHVVRVVESTNGFLRFRNICVHHVSVLEGSLGVLRQFKTLNCAGLLKLGTELVLSNTQRNELNENISSHSAFDVKRHGVKLELVLS